MSGGFCVQRTPDEFIDEPGEVPVPPRRFDESAVEVGCPPDSPRYRGLVLFRSLASHDVHKYGQGCTCCQAA